MEQRDTSGEAINKHTQQLVLDCLKHPEGIDWLKELFWSALNYTKENRSLPRPDQLNDILAEPSLLLAEDNGFQIIYSRLASERLRLTDERAVINRLRREHPYALFLFSNAGQSRWHFVNVKMATDTSPTSDGKRKRYLLRRIAIGPEEQLRTASERIAMLDVGPDATWLQQLGHSPSALEIQARHDEAFDVEAVTTGFFDGYTWIFGELQSHLFRETHDKVWAHDYALQFLNRLMFLYFIQRKRWLGDDPNFIKNFWRAYHAANRPQDTFFREWLSVLFFEAFNNKFVRKPYLPSELNNALQTAPFLNGGLFKRNELDDKHPFNVPDRILAELIHDVERNEPGFFERYNFTITETTPLDQEVAVDPEMIGKVYESLVNITFEGLKEEDLRGKAGIFYTPRVEIDLMSRLALVDYLTNHLGERYKSMLYEAVFAYDPDEKEAADDQLAQENLWPKLDGLLREITVLDPACGSGSFLVGMLLLLDDLLSRADEQLGTEETSYERRKRIIERSLYGVDAMEWAVQVAELRLWLQLVIETELEPAERKFRPLLPNLSFKVRPGDSLVQEIGGISFALHRDKRLLEIPKGLKGKLTRLKGEKRKFYYNDPSCIYRSEAEIKHAERSIFREIIEDKISSLQNEIVGLAQMIAFPDRSPTLTGIDPQGPQQLELQIEEWRRQQNELEAEKERLNAVLHALKSSDQVPFVWDIAFVEIFEGEKKGFDIVIGNPPYVRQEKIAPPTERPEEHGGENSEEWKSLKRGYKEKLQHSVAVAWPQFFAYRLKDDKQGRKLNGKSDYYVYFYLHGLRLLNEKGSFCFITSNSWLDVGYGKDLQEFLLKHSQVKLILDNEVKRSFAQADVNTIIALLAPANDRKNWGLDRTARFVMFKVPFEEILHPVIFEEIEEVQPGSRKPTPDYRAIAATQRELYKEGLAPLEKEENDAKIIKSARYVGNKWGGKYLRAPEIFFTILEKGKGKLVRLGEIAEVRFGIKTGANEFFYLEPTGKPAPEGLIHVRNGAGWEGYLEEEFLKPVIKSPREYYSIVISSDPQEYLFWCKASEESLEGTAAFEYIKWGEKQQVHKRPSCRGRSPWYSLNGPTAPTLLFPSAFFERYICYECPKGFVADKVFYTITAPSISVATKAFLNSSILALFMEVEGYHLNHGGIFNTTDWLKRLPVLSGTYSEIEEAYLEIQKREIRLIANEVKEQSRRTLDVAILRALGLPDSLLDNLHSEICRRVQGRILKARRQPTRQGRKNAD